jgi:D-alanine-D-alanine ligase
MAEGFWRQTSIGDGIVLIGLTYDLRNDYLEMGYSEEETAEFDTNETIDGIEQALIGLGHTVERIGCHSKLLNRLSSGASWDLVFNIAEGSHGLGREAQVPALLDAYHIPYTFSDPIVLGLCLHKAMTKRVVRDLGIPTARFCVVDDAEEIDLGGNMNFPLFVKPVAEGTSKGIDGRSIVRDMEELRLTCNRLLDKFKQPVLVEDYLPGREFTVGLVGTGKDAVAIGAMEILIVRDDADDVYSYSNKANYLETVRYEAVTDAIGEICKTTALKVWRGLGCRDGGRVDLKMDEKGIPHFLEVNPLAGLNPSHSDLPILSRLHGLSYQELIGRIVESAQKRIP